MKRFAIDVVILPPDNITDIAIEYNKRLRASIAENIELGKARYLPHISLLMGCLALDQLELITSRLDAIAKVHEILELSICNIRTDDSAAHGVVSFEIARTEQLVRLHESIVNSFRPFLTQDAKASDLADPPPIKDSTLQWINKFIPHACLENFWPHITLGFGENSGNGFTPISFQGSRLALCHLGNHCTCAEVLAEVSL
jgi:2'-5' RNA ligase